MNFVIPESRSMRMDIFFDALNEYEKAIPNIDKSDYAEIFNYCASKKSNPNWWIPTLYPNNEDGINLAFSGFTPCEIIDKTYCAFDPFTEHFWFDKNGDIDCGFTIEDLFSACCDNGFRAAYIERTKPMLNGNPDDFDFLRIDWVQFNLDK